MLAQWKDSEEAYEIWGWQGQTFHMGHSQDRVSSWKTGHHFTLKFQINKDYVAYETSCNQSSKTIMATSQPPGLKAGWAVGLEEQIETLAHQASYVTSLNPGLEGLKEPRPLRKTQWAHQGDLSTTPALTRWFWLKGENKNPQMSLSHLLTILFSSGSPKIPKGL
jgi:hypothetical protein